MKATTRPPREPKEPRRTGPAPIRTRSSKHRLRFHLVFVPKYRKRVLRGPIAARLAELIAQACEVHGWGLRELNVQQDHVHLLVQIGPSESVPGVAKRLKGGTSRALRSEFPELEEFLCSATVSVGRELSLWGANFWARGFFAETVGKVEEATVQAYIREQRP